MIRFFKIYCFSGPLEDVSGTGLYAYVDFTNSKFEGNFTKLSSCTKNYYLYCLR